MADPIGSPNNPAAPFVRRSENLDPLAADIRDFTAAVAVAKHKGEENIETSEEVIAFFNPNGLGGAKHFIYNGIMVCPYGQTEQIRKEMNEALSAKLHGAKEGILVGL